MTNQEVLEQWAMLCEQEVRSQYVAWDERKQRLAHYQNLAAEVLAEVEPAGEAFPRYFHPVVTELGARYQAMASEVLEAVAS